MVGKGGVGWVVMQVGVGSACVCVGGGSIQRGWRDVDHQLPTCAAMCPLGQPTSSTCPTHMPHPAAHAPCPPAQSQHMPHPRPATHKDTWRQAGRQGGWVGPTLGGRRCRPLARTGGEEEEGRPEGAAASLSSSRPPPAAAAAAAAGDADADAPGSAPAAESDAAGNKPSAPRISAASSSPRGAAWGCCCCCCSCFCCRGSCCSWVEASGVRPGSSRAGRGTEGTLGQGLSGLGWWDAGGWQPDKHAQQRVRQGLTTGEPLPPPPHHHHPLHHCQHGTRLKPAANGGHWETQPLGGDPQPTMLLSPACKKKQAHNPQRSLQKRDQGSAHPAAPPGAAAASGGAQTPGAGAGTAGAGRRRHCHPCPPPAQGEVGGGEGGGGIQV